jgi:hypothetical protein
LIQKREDGIYLEWHGKIHRTRHEQNRRMFYRGYKTERSLMNRKMIRLFLIGMLLGVMVMAAITALFAIPANDFRWRMEIYKRGGAAWTVDQNGHVGWKWLVEPISDTPRAKRVIVPPSQTDVRTERL